MAGHIPKPFQRPGIELSSGGAKKTWQTVAVADVHKGDLIKGRGQVLGVHSFDARQVTFDMFSGERLTFAADDPIEAFTEKRDGA